MKECRNDLCEQCELLCNDVCRFRNGGMNKIEVRQQVLYSLILGTRCNRYEKGETNWYQLVEKCKIPVFVI